PRPDHRRRRRTPGHPPLIESPSAHTRIHLRGPGNRVRAVVSGPGAVTPMRRRLILFFKPVRVRGGRGEEPVLPGSEQAVTPTSRLAPSVTVRTRWHGRGHDIRTATALSAFVLLIVVWRPVDIARGRSEMVVAGP